MEPGWKQSKHLSTWRNEVKMPHQVCLASLSRRSCDKYAFQELLHKLVKFSSGNEASFLSRSALVSCFISCIQKHRVSCKGLWLLNIMKQARDSHFRISTQVGTCERWPSQHDLEVVALAGSVSSAFCVWFSFSIVTETCSDVGRSADFSCAPLV